MQNNEAEPVLHQAVRLEDKGVVGVLLSADSQSQLARLMGHIVNKHQTQSKPNEGFHLNRSELLIAAAHGDSDEIKRLLPLHGEEDAALQPAEIVLDVEDAVTDVEKPAATAVFPSEAVTGAGDSVLHVVASSGDAHEFLETATVIVGKANHLLDACNQKGDTPLHCAARFRNARMVYHLLALARAGDGTSDERDGVGDERVRAILRMQNLKGETVLHEAVRLEDKKMIGELLSADSQLARVPLTDGASPLYLALSLGHRDIAQQLFEKDKELSYSGPDGQNALQAAVLLKRGEEATPKPFWRTMVVKVLTLFHLKSHLQKYILEKQSGKDIIEQSKDGIIKMILERNNDLIKQADRSTGRTPLHFAAKQGAPMGLLLEADPASMYLPDSNGSFPIHLAASNEQSDNVLALLQKNKRAAYCAQLCDGKGRTFLHVAVEKKRLAVVKYACQEQGKTLASSVMNMQDDQGNTALHLAVQVGDICIVHALVSVPEVKLDLTNKKRETPRELASIRYKHPGPHSRYSNQRSRIYWLLHDAAHSTASPRENTLPREIHNEAYRSQSIVNRMQIIGLGSAMLTVVTFAAAFAVPGGYRADGTPALAGQYAFDAFIVANTLAFISSGLSTIFLMFAGLGAELGRRTFSLLNSVNLLACSARSLGAAFAFGMYAMLSPVAVEATRFWTCSVTVGALVLVEADWAFRASSG